MGRGRGSVLLGARVLTESSLTEITSGDAAHRHTQLALSASHHRNSIENTYAALLTIFLYFFGIVIFLNVGFLPHVGLLKEHFHEFGLLIHELTVILVDKKRLHNEFIEAAEAILA